MAPLFSEIRASMIKQGDTVHLSASDLVGHLNCRHLTDLDVEATNGRIERPYFHDPLLEILIERGAIHERSYLEHLAGQGYQVVEIEGAGVTRALADRTLHAMRSGAQAIAQAALLHDGWGGRADLLLRVPTPSALGDWSYEAIDTKLARETRGGTILQLSLYSDLISVAQGLNPERMHVVIPGSGFEPESYRTAAFAAYYRYARRRLERSLAERTGISTYPEPKSTARSVAGACPAMRGDGATIISASWPGSARCRSTSSGGTTSIPRRRSPACRCPCPGNPRVARHSPTSAPGSRRASRWRVELRTGRSTRRCRRRPASDCRGCPPRRRATCSSTSKAIRSSVDGGLEYLFGYVHTHDDGAARYIADWALDARRGEGAFERFVDFVMARWARYPDLHVYHFAPYEPAALKRLMGRYATREDEIDRMLAAELLRRSVRVVRQSIRASVESYSIKKLEAALRLRASVALPDARRALARMSRRAWSSATSRASPMTLKRIVAGYNQDDCVSTLQAARLAREHASRADRRRRR